MKKTINLILLLTLLSFIYSCDKTDEPEAEDENKVKINDYKDNYFLDNKSYLYTKENKHIKKFPKKILKIENDLFLTEDNELYQLRYDGELIKALDDVLDFRSFDYRTHEDQIPLYFAMMKDGSLKSWGYNHEGMLGLGDLADYRVDAPVTVQNIQNVRTIKLIFGVTYAILENGSLMVWGNNLKLFLPIGKSYSDYKCQNNCRMIENTPVLVENITNVKDVHHKLIVFEDDSVAVWGENNNDRLKLGKTFTDYDCDSWEYCDAFETTPHKVDFIKDIKEVKSEKKYGEIYTTIFFKNGDIKEFNKELALISSDIDRIVVTRTFRGEIGDFYAITKTNELLVLKRGENDKYSTQLISINFKKFIDLRYSGNYKADPIYFKKFNGKVYSINQPDGEIHAFKGVDKLFSASNTGEGPDFITTYFLLKDGKLFMYGDNYRDTCGTSQQCERPTLMNGFEGIKNIVLYQYIGIYLIMNDGSLKVWGKNDLRIGHTCDDCTPTSEDIVSVDIK